MDWDQALILGMANGLVWGFIIALISLGLTLIFGVLRIINMAHGELYMLGAVLGWYVIQYTSSFWIALIIVPIIVSAFGYLMELVVLRKIEDKPILTIIATVGVAMILQQLVLMTFGGAAQRIFPPFRAIINIYGVGYDLFRVFVGGFSAVAILFLWLFLHKTRFGTWVRAVRQNKELALAVGIPTNIVYPVTFAIGAGLASMGGVLAAPIVALDFQMGLDMVTIALMVVIIGGLGSIQGSLVAAILLAELEGIASVFTSPTTARILQLLVMSLILFTRPQGIFGSK
jgi:branched-chain amino acid transport system permease protein